MHADAELAQACLRAVAAFVARSMADDLRSLGFEEWQAAAAVQVRMFEASAACGACIICSELHLCKCRGTYAASWTAMHLQRVRIIRPLCGVAASL